MKYTMKAGTLYFNEIMSARIKGTFTGPGKKIYSENGSFAMYTDIINLDVPSNERGNVRYRQYILFDVNGKQCAVASPDYAEGDNTSVVKWPICRIPKVDHATVVIDEKEYLLVMQNEQNYSLFEQSGKIAVQISHRGLSGGWNIESTNVFISEMICGIFVFCKYIEQENDFLIV